MRKTPHERAHDLCNRVEASGLGDDFTDALVEEISAVEKDTVAPFATALRDLVAVLQVIGNSHYSRILRLSGSAKAMLAYDSAVAVLAEHSDLCPVEAASGTVVNQSPALARDS
jgi:hypothetical protein